MADAAEYVECVRNTHAELYGPEVGNWSDDVDKSINAGWKLGYWVTLTNEIHLTLRITEMLAFPTGYFKPLTPGSASDIDSSDESCAGK